MTKEICSRLNRSAHQGSARIVTQVALASLLVIALPGIGRSEAPTDNASAPQTTSASQNAAAPQAPGASKQSQTSTAVSAQCNRPMPSGEPAAVTSPVPPK